MAEKLSKLLDSVNDIVNQISNMNKKQVEIEKQLDKIEQPYKNILYKMYIKGNSLVGVASAMNYNYEYICKLHGIALKKFEEVK